MPGVEGVSLWNFPFQMIRDQLRIPIDERRELAMEFEPFAWRPTLWKARVLHFQGHEKGDIDSQTADPDEVVNDHREATVIYTSQEVRPPDRLLKKLGSEPKIKIYAAAKDAASQWVGLLLYDEGEFESASDWFSDPRLKSRERPLGGWHSLQSWSHARSRTKPTKRPNSTKQTLRPNATAIASVHE